jgi:hypothetical protein
MRRTLVKKNLLTGRLVSFRTVWLSGEADFFESKFPVEKIEAFDTNNK